MPRITPKQARIALGLCIPAILVIFVAGCPPPAPGSPPGSPTAEELYDLITLTDPYEQWGQFPGAQGTIDSNPPHGPFARVFISSEVEGALGNFTGRLPEGSIIVKESFDADMNESGDSLTVMWKVDQFDPPNNDWFWASFRFDGTIRSEGRVAGCFACHGAARDNDFIFLQQF